MDTLRNIALEATMCYLAWLQELHPVDCEALVHPGKWPIWKWFVVAYLRMLSRKPAVELDERHEKLVITEEPKSEVRACAQLRIKL
jgi:hypothetical protein